MMSFGFKQGHLSYSAGEVRGKGEMGIEPHSMIWGQRPSSSFGARECCDEGSVRYSTTNTCGGIEFCKNPTYMAVITAIYDDGVRHGSGS